MSQGFSSSRGGRTSAHYWNTGYGVQVRANPYSVTLETSLDSKGGGITDVRVSVYPAGFKTLIDSMLAVDKRAALEAFGQALAEHHAKPAEQPSGFTAPQAVAA